MSAAPEKTRSRLDPEPMPRRDFLGLGALWAAGAALLSASVGMLRLPKAAVVSSPSKKFKVALPESLAAGQAFVPPGRSVAIFRDSEGVWAVSLVCTHLGCIVKQNVAGFECPCHGSRYTKDGTVSKGPAPKALAWRKVVSAGGTYLIDEDSTVAPGTKVKA
jgi:nitrite reductase/ring-hydroxylating ferredoxin subunit